MGSLSLFSNVDQNRALALAAQGNPQFTGVSLVTSTQAVPIPLHWGTRRISPNLVWQGLSPFQITPTNAVPIMCIPTAPDLTGSPGNGYTSGVGTTYTNGLVPPGAWQGEVIMGGGTGLTAFAGFVYGNQDSSSPDAKWWTPAMMALCHGLFVGGLLTITRIWNGGGARALPVNWAAGTILGANPSTDLSASVYDPTLDTPSLFYTLFDGDSGQTAWSFFAYALTALQGPFYNLPSPGQDLAYRGIAYIASPLFCYGKNNSPPQQAFEVVRSPPGINFLTDSYSLGRDMAWPDVIKDLFTHPIYGMGLLSSDFEATSWTHYLDYCMSPGLHFTPLLGSEP